MTMLKTLVFLASVTIAIVNVAMAANYTVGAPNGGWDQSTNFATWASPISFFPGDNLLFVYTQNHDVTEVNEADFDSCNSNNPLQPPFSGGSTVIPLSDAGSRYFICGIPGHCLAGMKLQVDTLAASTPPAALTPPPNPAPRAPSPPPSARRPASSPPAVISDPTSPPAAAHPPPPPAPSSAGKVSVIGSLMGIACSAVFVMLLTV